MPNQKVDDGSINKSDNDTLVSAGIDLSGGSSETISDAPVDVDGEMPKDSEIKDSGINFVHENKEDLSSLAEEKMKATSKDLENEFKSSLSEVKPVSSPSSTLAPKKGSLSTLLSKVQEKLGMKKKAVKDELGSLKKMKDAISEDIEEIKKLEASEGKIREEIEKIGSIEEEVQTIEKEFEGKV
jgi:chromosome segregation ATPase